MNVVTTDTPRRECQPKISFTAAPSLGKWLGGVSTQVCRRTTGVILDLINARVTVGYLIAKLSDYPVKQVHDWLDELETLFFIDAVTLPEDSDLIRRAA